MSLIAAGLSAVGGLVNSLINRKTSKDNTIRTINAQKQLAEYSYSKDLEMWNKANAYNTPSMQMKRLKDAGLNPNIVYGSGSVAGNTTTQTPKYQAFNPSYHEQPLQIPDIGKAIQMYQDVKAKQVQIDNLNEDKRSKEINNMFLGSLLSHRVSRAIGENMKMAQELGQKEYGEYWSYSDMKDSPYMRGFHATVNQKQLENNLKTFEHVLRSKGVNATDSLFMRMMTMDKAGYNVQNLLPYMFTDTLGRSVPKLNLGFGKMSQPSKGVGKYYNSKR